MDDIDPEQSSHERLYGERFFGPKDPDITENREFIEQKQAEEKQQREREKLLDTLRQTQPSALKEPGSLFGGGPPDFPARTQDEPRRTDFQRGTFEQAVPAAQNFPGPEIPEGGGGEGFLSLNCSFLLKNATTVVNGNTVRRVLVQDGKINGTFPAGMGFGSYFLTVPTTTDTYFIIAGLTFNPTTQEITSRFLQIETATNFPITRVESATSGFIYWQLGFVFFTGPPAAKAMTVWQTLSGDINFVFAYGQKNGVPALLPVTSNPGYISLQALLAP